MRLLDRGRLGGVIIKPGGWGLITPWHRGRGSSRRRGSGRGRPGEWGGGVTSLCGVIPLTVPGGIHGVPRVWHGRQHHGGVGRGTWGSHRRRSWRMGRRIVASRHLQTSETLLG